MTYKKKGKEFQMKKIKILLISLVLAFVVQSFSNVFAQESQQSTSFNRGGAQYILGDRDEILMNVNVWGFVLRPGQYVVPRHTDLITLISFAGGPREGANLGEVRIVRESTAALTNGNATNGHEKKIPILTVNINDHIKKGKVGVLPVLRAGDTVLITESGGHKFQKFMGINSVFGVVAAVASVALIVDRLSK